MNVAIRIGAWLLCAAACTRGPGVPGASVNVVDAGTDRGSASEVASAVPSASSTPAPATCGPDERRYGTTCCFSEEGSTSCHGPNVGAPCKRKGDCDVMCGCDDPKLAPPRQGSSPGGPASGTLGVTGRCVGEIVDGAWYCVIDENGVVSHFIRN